MKKALKIAGCVLLALVILVLGYVAYVFWTITALRTISLLQPRALPHPRPKQAFPTPWCPIT